MQLPFRRFLTRHVHRASTLLLLAGVAFGVATGLIAPGSAGAATHPSRADHGGAAKVRARAIRRRRRAVREIRLHRGVVRLALRERGTPYAWGGSSPSGFDCSGLVAWAYGKLGVSLPHYTQALWHAGAHVRRGGLASGDLVFFHGLSHVGIYIGHGEFVHSPHSGDVVRISRLRDAWYASGYDGAVRIG